MSPVLCRGKNACQGYLGDAMKNLTNIVFPKDVAERCKGRLFIATTQARPGTQSDVDVLIGRFSNRDQLLDTVYGSSWLPYFSGTQPVFITAGNRAYYDGAFTVKIPCPPGQLSRHSFTHIDTHLLVLATCCTAIMLITRIFDASIATSNLVLDADSTDVAISDSTGCTFLVLPFFVPTQQNCCFFIISPAQPSPAQQVRELPRVLNAPSNQWHLGRQTAPTHLCIHCASVSRAET
jgi:hypothetical protein